MRAPAVFRSLVVGIAVLTCVGAAQTTQTFTGVITDEECALGDHSRMKMGANDAECTRACVAAHGSRFVLSDGKRAYILSDQDTPDALAGQQVQVIGTLDAKTMTIRVQSIAPAR